jgi:uncharacterized membrane protein YidH (DUF202 family)
MKQNSLTETKSLHEQIQDDNSRITISNPVKIKYSKGLIDALMVIGFAVCIISLKFVNHKEISRNARHEEMFSWGTPHCIVSLLLIGVMIIHIMQNWTLIKGIILKKRFRKNKVTTITFVSFIFTVISIFLYLSGFNMITVHIHGLVVQVFLVILIVHLILNFKKLLKLFTAN